MDKPVCRVRNLRASALAGFVSEIDAVATGGRYLSPDASGWFDANSAHDLCVACAYCGSVVTKPEAESQLSCADCGQNEFHVVQTVAPPPRRPSYSPLTPTPVPTPSSPRPSDDADGDSPVVSPWARWAARTLDITLFFFVAIIVLAMFLGVLGCDVSNISSFGAAVLGIPPGLALEALCYHLFGLTPGKWLFAVKVRHQDGTRLTFAEYFKRSAWCFVKGYGLWIPIVSLVTQVVQYNRLRSGKPASYDIGKDVKIVRVRHDVIRTVFGIAALVLLAVFLAACNA